MNSTNHQTAAHLTKSLEQLISEAKPQQPKSSHFLKKPIHKDKKYLLRGDDGGDFELKSGGFPPPHKRNFSASRFVGNFHQNQ